MEKPISPPKESPQKKIKTNHIHLSSSEEKIRFRNIQKHCRNFLSSQPLKYKSIKPIDTKNIITAIATSLKAAQGIKKEEIIHKFKSILEARIKQDNERASQVEEPPPTKETENNNQMTEPNTPQKVPIAILDQNIEWKTFQFNLRVQIAGTTTEERTEEIQNIVDKTMDLCRKNEIQILLLPRNDPHGTPIKQMGQPKKLRFADVKPTNFAKYINPWVLRQNPEWSFTSFQLHVKCSVHANELYYKMATRLFKKDIEITPRRMSLRSINSLPLAGMLPAVNTLDTKALSFEMLTKHGVYISFETAKIKNGAWINCNARDEECAGYIITIDDDEVIKCLHAIKAEWPPFKLKKKYLLDVELHVFPMDDQGNFHKKALEKYPNLSYLMNLDFQHSIYSVETGGGRIQDKLISSIDSLHHPIVDKNGNQTTLRKFITQQKDPELDRPFITNVAPTPTSGNAASLLTTFTTYRASNERKTKEIAKRAQEFVKKLPELIWKNFDEETVTRILAPSKCQKLALKTALSKIDVPEMEPIYHVVIPETEAVEIEDEEMEDATLGTGYKSISSDMSIATQKTSTSTKQKVNLLMEQNDALQKRNEIIETQFGSLQKELEELRKNFRRMEPTQSDDESNKSSRSKKDNNKTDPRNPKRNARPPNEKRSMEKPPWQEARQIDNTSNKCEKNNGKENGNGKQKSEKNNKKEKTEKPGKMESPGSL